MNTVELKLVVDEMREGKHYPNIDASPLDGIGLPYFDLNKQVSKEVIVNFLREHCFRSVGIVDDEELVSCLYLLKKKKVIMV